MAQFIILINIYLTKYAIPYLPPAPYLASP